MWFQSEIILNAKPRGFHLITNEIFQQVPEIHFFKVGLAHFFIQHTSASLAINENADPSVRVDMESYFNRAVVENEPYFTHTLEGPDDMPAHIKTLLIGNELTIPLDSGNMRLGTWQGLYLCEHRDFGGKRRVIITINGEQN